MESSLRETCSNHQRQVAVICVERSCLNRLQCDECRRVHPNSHGYMSWNIKRTLTEAADKWARCQKVRLDLIGAHLKERFDKELMKLLDRIGEQITNKQSTIFNEWMKSPDTTFYINQLLSNNFAELGEQQLQQINDCVRYVSENPISQPTQLSDKDISSLGSFLRKIASELSIVKDIFWGQLHVDVPQQHLQSTIVLDRTQSVAQEKPIHKTVLNMLGLTKAVPASSRFSDKKKQIQQGEQKLLKKLYKKGKVEVRLSDENLNEHGLLFVCQHLSTNFQMKSLSLEKNSIDELGPLSYLSPHVDKNITLLNLSKNNIHAIDALVSLNMPFLKELKLSNNSIISIEVLSRAAWPKLTLLNLAKNKFTRIDAVAFVVLDELVELVLNENTLQSIEPLSRAEFAHIQWIKLVDVDIRDRKLHNKYAFRDERVMKSIWYD